MKIEQGILIPATLIPVSEGISGAGYAIVVIEDLSQRCVVKKVGDREIAAECLCALLGDALGLPTLIPVIVSDPRNGSLWFGAREASYPSLSSRLGIGAQINTTQLRALAYILSKWAQVGQVISFDELVANGDRNPGNILWNGAQFTLIDHERALGNHPMELNKLALFATNNFDTALTASIHSASTSAALAQQALLGADSRIWQKIAERFATSPNVISRHFSTLTSLAQGNLGSLASNTANAMTPMLAGERK